MKRVLGQDARSSKARFVRWLALGIASYSCSSGSEILPPGDAAPENCPACHDAPAEDVDADDGGAARDARAGDVVDVDCATEPGTGGRICGGSYTIAKPEDLGPIADCQRITGDLTVHVDGWTVTLDVEQIDGDVTVDGSGSAHLTKLVRVQGEFSITGLATLTAPRLRSAAGNLFSVFAGSASFDCLAGASRMYVAGDVVRFPRLKTVGQLELAAKGQVDFSELWSAPQIMLSGVNEVTFPALRHALNVSADTGRRLSIPIIEELTSIEIAEYDHVDIGAVRLPAASKGISLRNVGEAIFPRLMYPGRSLVGSVRDRLSLPALQAVESLTLNSPQVPGADGVAVELPALETAELLTFQSTGADHLGIRSVDAGKLRRAGMLRFANTSLLTVIAFPALESLAAASFTGNADLRAIHLPALTTVQTPPVEGFLDIGASSCANCQPPGNPKLSEFDFSALQYATVRIRRNPLLPQCKVDALATQLQQAGLGGTVVSMDNNPACPP